MTKPRTNNLFNDDAPEILRRIHVILKTARDEYQAYGSAHQHCKTCETTMDAAIRAVNEWCDNMQRGQYEFNGGADGSRLHALTKAISIVTLKYPNSKDVSQAICIQKQKGDSRVLEYQIPSSAFILSELTRNLADQIVLLDKNKRYSYKQELLDAIGVEMPRKSWKKMATVMGGVALALGGLFKSCGKEQPTQPLNDNGAAVAPLDVPDDARMPPAPQPENLEGAPAEGQAARVRRGPRSPTEMGTTTMDPAKSSRAR